MTMWGKFYVFLNRYSHACTLLSIQQSLVAPVESFIASEKLFQVSNLGRPAHIRVKMSPDEGMKFNCIITGAGGFVGQALASALIADPLVSKLTLTDVFKPDIPHQTPQSISETRSLDADLTSLEICQSLFTPDINLIYLLHGIMSSAAEANLELGLRVNIDSTRQILDILRRTNPGVKVVYPSSLAVYGPPATPTTKITELNTPVPGTSYGAQKHICETLIDDYSRRGLLDGRVCRLPTVNIQSSLLTSQDFNLDLTRLPLGQVSPRELHPLSLPASFASH